MIIGTAIQGYDQEYLVSILGILWDRERMLLFYELESLNNWNPSF